MSRPLKGRKPSPAQVKLLRQLAEEGAWLKVWRSGMGNRATVEVAGRPPSQILSPSVHSATWFAVWDSGWIRCTEEDWRVARYQITRLGRRVLAEVAS